MKVSQWSKKFYLGILVLFSIFLVACGRDVSTVDNALEGTWTLTDAYMNGEPLVDVLTENAEWFGIDESEITTNEDGEVVYDVEFYYEEGLMTVVNSDGETTEMAYEVLSTDEENGTMRLEYTVDEEDMTIVLQEDVAFVGEERESRTSAINIVDIQMDQGASEAGTELEQELEQFGQELARELFQSIEFTFHFDFVSEEAPAAVAE